MGHGSGLVVSILAGYSDNPSSNPAGYLNFLYEKAKRHHPWQDYWMNCTFDCWDLIWPLPKLASLRIDKKSKNHFSLFLLSIKKEEFKAASVSFSRNTFSNFLGSNSWKIKYFSSLLSPVQFLEDLKDLAEQSLDSFDWCEWSLFIRISRFWW